MRLIENIRINLVIPLFWWVKKIPYRKFYKQFKAKEFQSLEDNRNDQSKQLEDLLLYALDTSPFYKSIDSKSLREKIIKNPYEAIRAFPVVGKDEYRVDLDKFKTDCSRPYYKNSSGGSTGKPVTVLQDIGYKGGAVATTAIMFEWAKKRRGSRYMRLWGAERDLVGGGKGFRQLLSNLITGRKTINAFLMSPKQMYKYVDEINRFKPELLEGYADSLYSLAKFIEQSGLLIHSPKSILSSAGTLLPHMREKIEKVFKCEVFNRYGCREVGNIASECEEHSGMHVFTETSYVELLGPDNQPVPVGEEGRIVITNLLNRVMPMIRYEIGDVGIFSSEPCACGRPYPLLKEVVGRNASIFRTKSGGYLSPVLFAHLMGVMHGAEQIERFQIVQESLDRINIIVQADGDFDLDNWDARADIASFIKSAMDEDAEITFEKAIIKPNATGKYDYMVSKL